jgi:hypothetical protein
MTTPINQQINYDVTANSAKFVAESAKQKTAAEQVREAIAKGTRELTKQEIAALGAAEATKKINKAAIDAAASVERMRRQFELAKVPAAGLVQSIGGMASGLMSVIGRVSMVAAGFREVYALSKAIDTAIANWDAPDWLFSTAGSKMQNRNNRARMQQGASFTLADNVLTLAAAERDRAAGYAELARQGRGVTAGASGFSDGQGFAGVIAGNTMNQNWIGSDFGRGSRRGGRARANMGDVAGQTIGWGNQLFTGMDAMSMASGAAGGVTGFGDSNASMLGQSFGGGAAGDFSAKTQAMDEFTAKLQDQTSLVGGAFATMSAGVAAGIEAAISGSQSIGQAIKTALAAQLKSIAIESGVRALFETAKGFAALAIGSPTAGAHFKSAGIFAATAIAAGVGSAALGGGASASAGAAGGASQTAGLARGSSNSSNSGGGGVTYIIHVSGVVGDGAEVANQISRSMTQAERSGKASAIRNGEAQVSRYD